MIWLVMEPIMFTEEVLEKLSYKCGCQLDVKPALGIINGLCPNHPENKLLFDGMPLETYKAFLQAKKKKLDRDKSSKAV
jgi:hypothetical protein